MNGAHITTTIPGLLFPPDPAKDRHRKPLPAATIELLILLQFLLVYARHLHGLLRQAAERGLSLLARCFGSAQASFVLTHFTRGILRAIALQRVLLTFIDGPRTGGQPRKRTPRTQQSAPRSPRASHGRRPALPTLRQLEAAVRRRPVDDVLDDIRRDLGTAFSLCDASFGNALRDMAAAYRDTLSNIFHEIPGREAVTADAPEQHSPFAYPPRIPDAIRYILGCFGTQRPVRGFPLAASPVGAAIDGAQPP